jgi:hypothetical protein
MSMLTPAELTAGAMLAVAASHNVASNSLRIAIINAPLCKTDLGQTALPRRCCGRAVKFHSVELYFTTIRLPSRLTVGNSPETLSDPAA